MQQIHQTLRWLLTNKPPLLLTNRFVSTIDRSLLSICCYLRGYSSWQVCVVVENGLVIYCHSPLIASHWGLFSDIGGLQKRSESGETFFSVKVRQLMPQGPHRAFCMLNTTSLVMWIGKQVHELIWLLFSSNINFGIVESFLTFTFQLNTSLW